MSAFDALRATLAATRPDDACVWGTLDQLRAAVAEHDALLADHRGVSEALGLVALDPYTAATCGSVARLVAAALRSERARTADERERAQAAADRHHALRDAVRTYLSLHWTATAEWGAHDQTEASVDAAVAAEMAALDALRGMVHP